MQPPDRVALHGREISLQNLSHLQQFSGKRREAKLQEIQVGAQLLQSIGLFPSRRHYKDVVWAVLFLVMVAATAGFCTYYFKGIDTSLNEDSAFRGHQTHNHMEVEDLVAHVGRLIMAGVAGTVGSLVAAFFFMMLAKACAKPLVYVALFFMPTLYMIAGASLLVVGLRSEDGIQLIIAGGILLAIGICYTSCVFFCWRRYIPFTIEVVEMVAEVSNDNPCMVAVSVFGSILSGIWTVLVAGCWVAVRVKYQSDLPDQHMKANHPINYAFVAVLMWGGSVIHNVCHTSYCGVFGRWYFNQGGWPLSSSIRAALTTSFGSICLGSLTVTAIRVVEIFVRTAKNEAASEGNAVACVVLCLLDCVISCIGDILEYFNDWVYVQCALRGTAFCQSVRATYALIVCNGVQYIISDLLVDSVVAMGAFISALVGAGLGLAVAVSGSDTSTGVTPATSVKDEYTLMAIVGALMGYFGGLIGGGSAMSIFSSGTKALLTCWAEDPGPLQEEYGDMHDMITEKVRMHENMM